MLQELLTNVMRHARATMAAITLEQQGGNLTLEVRDDGIGIAQSQVADAGSLGLLGLRERARVLGGELTICGSPGKGTTATVRIPVGS
jgi:signal transduction histidine kinase